MRRGFPRRACAPISAPVPPPRRWGSWPTTTPRRPATTAASASCGRRRRRPASPTGCVTWPDFPIEYVPQPAWARGAAPHLYFLFYRAPAAFNRPPVHRYLVPPVEPEMPPEQQEKLLRATNDSVIKTNHVVHHGGIGHHVQNWNAYHAASRIGQMAAVDSASRIAMFCGGTMAEGWAVYATGLMDEVGFLTPLESYAERHSRRRMAARAVVDVKLHRGEFSLDEAAEFYEVRGGMGREMARQRGGQEQHVPRRRHDVPVRLRPYPLAAGAAVCAAGERV